MIIESADTGHAAATQRRSSTCGRAQGLSDERLRDRRIIDHRSMSQSVISHRYCHDTIALLALMFGRYFYLAVIELRL